MIATNKLQPRARFIEDSKRADAHQELMLSPVFKSAVEIALLDYVMSLQTSSLQSAAETAYKLEGARGFIERLLNLGDKTRPLNERKTDELIPP